jgi:hypothetical protein
MYGALDHLPSHLEKIFEATLNLEIKSALFRPMVIIIQFILGPNCVTVENWPFGFNGFLGDPESEGDIPMDCSSGTWIISGLSLLIRVSLYCSR